MDDAPDVRDPPPDADLQDFRHDVLTWLEVDNSIRSLQEAIRQRRHMKRGLTERIVQFMARHELDAINTPATTSSAQPIRLQRRVVYTRAPLSHTTIRDRLRDYCMSAASSMATSSSMATPSSSSDPDASSMGTSPPQHVSMLTELHGVVLGDPKRSEKLLLVRR